MGAVSRRENALVSPLFPSRHGDTLLMSTLVTDLPHIQFVRKKAAEYVTADNSFACGTSPSHPMFIALIRVVNIVLEVCAHQVVAGAFALHQKFNKPAVEPATEETSDVKKDEKRHTLSLCTLTSIIIRVIVVSPCIIPQLQKEAR